MRPINASARARLLAAIEWLDTNDQARELENNRDHVFWIEIIKRLRQVRTTESAWPSLDAIIQTLCVPTFRQRWVLLRLIRPPSPVFFTDLLSDADFQAYIQYESDTEYWDRATCPAPQSPTSPSLQAPNSTSKSHVSKNADAKAQPDTAGSSTLPFTSSEAPSSSLSSA